jgi:hypothetical protein
MLLFSFVKVFLVIVCPDLGQCHAPTWVLPKRDSGLLDNELNIIKKCNKTITFEN